MKKLIGLFLAILFVFSLAVTAGANANDFTTADAMKILRAVAGIITLTEEDTERYDLNGDGVINTADALIILRLVAGLPAIAPPKPEPPPTPQLSEEETFIAEVVRLVNIERKNNGLSELSTGNALLNTAAKIRADELLVLYSHDRPCGGRAVSAYIDLGGRWNFFAENIAHGQTSPQRVVESWMNSDGHRRNILNSNYTYIGVGVAKNENGRLYWVQLFVGLTQR
jgi:uncharacterized protein YkwD